VIKSPGFPDNYYESMDCEWIITAPTGQQVELRVKTFELESHQNCRFDFLEIRNGGTSQAPLVGTYCGKKILKRIVSFGNKVYLKFTSDSSRSEKGFEIEWDSTTTGCGGVMTSPRGSISSPNYPEPYGANAQCVWRISISEGSSLQMIFVDLDLEAQPSCVYDYVEIFDGRDPSDKKLGKFCTTEMLQPLQLETTGNHAFVRLITDATHQLRGFNLRYNFNCNRTIENLHNGVIESPNFPENYPNNLNCEWRIKATKGNKIQYEFSHFDLENLDKIEGTKHVCQFDFVELVDRNENVDLSSAKYCNAMTEPITKITEGDELVIRFNTDSSGAESGFRMEWEVHGCGGILNHPRGTFSSPNYPMPYPHNTDCQWTIVVEYGNIIELTFEDFDFETSENCHYDGLHIFNVDKDGGEIVKLCHTSEKPTRVVSSGHQMFVKFFSDSSNAHKGFQVGYKVLPATCGGTFLANNGFIYSPQYPKNYGPNLVCEWHIVTDKSHTLNVGFMDFDLENSPNCTHDSITIYDGLTKNELLRKECGSSEVATVHSKRNEVTLVFKTDESVEAKGFKLNFTTVSGHGQQSCELLLCSNFLFYSSHAVRT
jgi:cubilin